MENQTYEEQKELMPAGEHPKPRRSYTGDMITAVSRAAVVITAIFLQFLVIALSSLLVLRYAVMLYFFFEVIGVFLALAIVYDGESYRFFWVVMILLLPLVGLSMYLMWGSSLVHHATRKRMTKEETLSRESLSSGEGNLKALKATGNRQFPTARYLAARRFPLYRNADVKYYSLGDLSGTDLCNDLARAKKHIYLEYFFVLDGEFWETVLGILTAKVKEGVEVYLLIDDVGSIRTNNRAFRRDMKARGIHLGVFAPISKDLSKLALNYRNHCKITVIDDEIGYTGGINFSDEYFNIYPKYGHWKDALVRISGDGVESLSAAFRSMWNFTVGDRGNRLHGNPAPMDSAPLQGPPETAAEEAFVQPFTSSPYRKDRTNAYAAYMNLIAHAQNSLYITTPYLVLDRSVIGALIRAAESGVDVRIYAPGQYDKWYVYQVTEATFGKLLRAGVRIFTYTPGFLHAKTLVSDKECAVCGSINLDYRSFYFHYEDAVVFYGGRVVSEIRKDILETEEKCHEVTYQEWHDRPLLRRIVGWLLSFCAPLF